ncbi:hypothetical protein LWI29_003021 [Acer saccharum]|uniref:Reverse transcriptase Ty1/copia-type domain-containing protein n=1 Tax=Acer saccharum TaxID=4024 RepID=A0AA39SS79_ACESA|nr:hypothetical protein LWI29_003021 [Acer saccharum]
MSSDQSNTQNNWILDTGASHHMTSDLQNLSLHSEYGGTENIMVGDGKTIPITHTGFTSLNTPTTSFSLNHVLCSPHISQNIVSVSKFCTHNNTSIEFFPNYFIVKDLTTGASLVRGQNMGNLYVWPKSSLLCPSSAHQYFASSQSTVSAQSWHCRLGHPALSILQQLLSSHNLPVSKSDKNFSHYPATSRVFVSRHVVFVENIFPFSTTMNSAHSDPLLTATRWLQFPFHNEPSHGSTDSTSDQVSPPLLDSSLTDIIPIHMQPPHNSLSPTPVPHLIESNPPAGSSHHTAPLSTQQTNTLPPNQSSSVHTDSEPAPLPHDPVIIHSSHQIHTRSKSQIFKPKAIFDLHTTAISTPQTEPTNLSQAHKFLEWRHAISAEYDALVQNGTWKLVPSSSTQNVVGCKWIFRIKRHPDGSVARYKARLVAKDFNQRPGVDFTETYSPVVKPVTVRLILTFAVTNGWPLRQLDVNNAFLQGSLTDDVYMEQPTGFVDASLPHHVCKLQKAIYGLRQAPRAWYNELRTFLLATGFLDSKCDASLFVRHHSG